MARTRSIKPGFFKNEELAELPYQDRLCFAALWCWADREGRLEDRPKRLRGEIFPYDHEVDVEACLLRLQSKGFIIRYTASAQRYIAIPKFGLHQSPHHKEQASTIPAPDMPETCPVVAAPSTLPPVLPSTLPPLNESPGPKPPRLPKGYAFDEQYKTFREACASFGMAVIESDFAGPAWHEWCALDPEQRQAAIVGIGARAEAGADPQMVPRPHKYLVNREWKRAINGASRAHESLTERMIREAKG